MSRRSLLQRILTIPLVCLIASFSSAAERITDLRPTVILVSIDGFRPDYLDKVETPNLHAIMERGVHAKYMIPSFPTTTFPNHYTIATGLYPAHHGIVANHMYDPSLDARFNKNDPESQHDARWWGGEPIWITAEKQGLRTAPLMWPGSMVERSGIRPEYQEASDDGLTASMRVNKLVSLLDLAPIDRPQFLTLCLPLVDEAGRHFGPDSSEVKRAISETDAAMGQLLTALRDRGIEDRVNLVVVSDHGMAPVPRKKTVFLDDYIDPNSVDVVDRSPVLSLRPKDGNVQALYEKTKRIPHAKAYLPSDMPARWHYSGSDRIPPVVIVADNEWTITSRDYSQQHPNPDLGNYGFDNADKNMRAIFMAEGPAFYHDTLKPFPNVDVYSLLAYLLNIVPAKTDGTLDVFHNVLIERTQSQPTRKQLAPWQKEWDEVAQLMNRRPSER